MTSWRHVTSLFLFVFLSMVDLSKQGCGNNFDMESLAGNLTESVSLVRTKDPQDTLECTVERECQRRGGTGLACNLLGNCYGRDSEKKSEKCEVSQSLSGETSQVVYFYHFVCLVAKSLNITTKGCEYDLVCKLYSEKTSTVFAQTTTLPPPPSPPPTTTLPPTTTAPTTLPETTTSTTVLPPTATTLAPTSKVTQSSDNGSNDKFQTSKNETDNFKIILLVSIIFNVIGPLAIYLYMRHRWAQDRIQWTSTAAFNGNSPADQQMIELQPNIPLVSKNGAVETTHLMQPSECRSVLIHSAEAELQAISRKCGEGMHH